MQRFNSLTLLIFAVVCAAIAKNIPQQIFSNSNPDTIIRCFEQMKLNKCAEKMNKIIRANRGEGRDDPASTLDNPFNLNKDQFDILCRGADAFSGCVDGYNLKELCPTDPLIVQLDGYLYQCSEPQRSVIDSYFTCISKYNANPDYIAPTIDWTKCNQSDSLSPQILGQDRCRLAQNMMNCMRQVYRDGPCGSIEFYDVYVSSNEKLNPGAYGCELERAVATNLKACFWNILHMLILFCILCVR